MVNAQKIKYKEIKPLLEGKKYDEALPKLITYYQQNTKDDAWTSKAILMEMDNMFDASKNIASIFYDKANNQESTSYADSAIIWYNIMVKDKHPDAGIANQRISELNEKRGKWGVFIGYAKYITNEGDLLKLRIDLNDREMMFLLLDWDKTNKTLKINSEFKDIYLVNDYGSRDVVLNPKYKDKKVKVTCVKKGKDYVINKIE